MRELLVAAVAAALLGSAVRAGEKDAAAPAQAPIDASAPKKKDAGQRRPVTRRAREKKPGASKAAGTEAAKPAGGDDAGPKSSVPCEPVKPCAID